MHFLGVDIGSSFIKASIIEAGGRCVGAATKPDREMTIISAQPGWAEQEPEMWWKNVCDAVRAAYTTASAQGPIEVDAIGISYQMHGLVLMGKDSKPLRPAIIWCDSRAVEIGNKAFAGIGPDICLNRLLNSPGNFTASKLKWVKDNEPGLFAQASHLLLPGDYIAYMMTGKAVTSVGGLSEGMLWDFSENRPASILLDYYGIPRSFIPEIVPTFGIQGGLSKEAAAQMGLKAGTPVTYRAGDQPNNAFSLNVLEPTEVAATAGTSGVIYGVTDRVQVDTASRVNTFAHVNHVANDHRLGVLLCVNGTGIANAWTKRLLGDGMNYEEMNRMAASIPIGSDGLSVLPFGNGAERMLNNKDIGAHINGLNFNRHSKAHVSRAIQEGIAFALTYGMEIMEGIGVKTMRVRAGLSNMFLSPVFRGTLAGTLNAVIELYNTDGAQGAARGAGLGVGAFSEPAEAFEGLSLEGTVEPDPEQRSRYADAYHQWRDVLAKTIKSC